MWTEQQRNDNNSDIVTAIVCPPPDSHFVCETWTYERDWPLILGISKSVCRLQWDISFEAFVYFGFIGPKMRPIHLGPTQRFCFFLLGNTLLRSL